MLGRIPDEDDGDESVPDRTETAWTAVDRTPDDGFTLDEWTRERSHPTPHMDASDLPTAVAEYLSRNRTELFAFTETLVGYDTRNPPGRTVSIVEWLETTLDEPPLSVDRFEVDPEKANLVATLPGRTEHPLCFNGHLDTIPFDGSDWSTDPLSERAGERIYGRGTTARNARHSVSVADRGNVWLTLEASGTAARGSRPMIGENAIDELTGAIELLRSDFGQRELSVDASMNDVVEESIGFYELEVGADATRIPYTCPTSNLGTIEGGTASNTVPASACGRVDARVTAGVDTEEPLGGVRNCLAGTDGIENTGLSWTRGSSEPLGRPIVEASANAAERVADGEVHRRTATGGGDAKGLRRDGIPTVEFGFGTRTAHGTDEYTTIEALVRNAISYGTLPVPYERYGSAGG